MGNGSLILLKQEELEAKDIKHDTKETKGKKNKAVDKVVCTPEDRSNGSNVTLRKNHQSSVWDWKTVRVISAGADMITQIQRLKNGNRFVTADGGG